MSKHQCLRTRSTSLITVALAFVFAFSFTSCNDSPNEPPGGGDSWYDMFDPATGIIIIAAPNYYTTTDTIIVTVTVRPNNTGVGFWLISGYNGGGSDPIGTAYSPIAGAFGLLAAPIAFEEGREVSIAWKLTLNQTMTNSARLGLAAVFDSVLVDGTMYAVESPELIPYFGFDFITSTADLLTLR